jgi:hypothetical protein
MKMKPACHTQRQNKQNSLFLLRHSYDMMKTETTTAARITSLSSGERETYTIATSPLHTNMEYHDEHAAADADDTANPIYPNPNDPPPNWRPVEVRMDDASTATTILDITTTTTTTTSSLHSLLNPPPPPPPNLQIPTPHTNVPNSMNTTTVPPILAAVMTWNSLWYLTLLGVAYFYMQSHAPKKERMREWWWWKHTGRTLRALVDAVRTLVHVTEVHVRTTMYHWHNLLHGWGWETNLNGNYHRLDPSDFDDDDDDDDTNSGKNHLDNDNHQAVLRSNRIQYYQNSIQSMVAPFLRTRRRRQQRQRSHSLPDLDDGRGHAHPSSRSHHHHHHINNNNSIATCTNLNDPDYPTPSANDCTNRHEKTVQNPDFGNEVNTNRTTARTTLTSASRNNNSMKTDNHTFTFRPHNQSYYTKTNYWKDTYETNHSIPLEPAFIEECDYPDNWMMYHPMYRVISKRQMEQLDDGHQMPSWSIPPTNSNNNKNNNQEAAESTTARNEPPPPTIMSVDIVTNMENVWQQGSSHHNNSIATVSDPTSYIELQQQQPSPPCGIGSGIINHPSVGTCNGSHIDHDVITTADTTTTTTPTPNHLLQPSPTAGTTQLEEPTKTSRSSNSESDRNLPILLRSVVAT